MIEPIDREGGDAGDTAVAILENREGRAIVRKADDSLRVTVEMRPGMPWSGRASIVTRYPLPLIRKIFEVKGPGWVVDEIARDEDADYVERVLKHELLAFVPASALTGARILDFGCGSGASTMCLARLFPGAEIVGTDFNEEFLSIARDRAEIADVPTVRFIVQPSPSTLPTMPTFDLIVLSAVVEHMLPDERRAMLPQVWAHLAVGGHLFVSDTPHRWFPIEAHSTNLRWLNYQSDAAAFRRATKQGALGAVSWNEMLRAGIRGSTEREIIDCLTSGVRTQARMIGPRGEGIASRSDLWRRGLTPGRREFAKGLAHRALALGELLTGSLVTQNITLCLQRVS